MLTRVGVGAAGVHAVAVVVALVLVVYLHVVAGEMVPKNISISSPESAVRWLAPPLVRVSRLFAIFWLCSSFAVVLIFSLLFRFEEENGAATALLLSPLPVQGLWLGKTLAGGVLLVLCQTFFFPAAKSRGRSRKHGFDEAFSNFFNLFFQSTCCA